MAHQVTSSREAEAALKNRHQQASPHQKDEGQETGLCKKYQHRTDEDWSKVMYSEESTFRGVRATRNRVRRPSGYDRINSWDAVKTLKYPASLIVRWLLLELMEILGSSSFHPMRP